MCPVTNPRKEDIKKIKIKQGSLFYLASIVWWGLFRTNGKWKGG